MALFFPGMKHGAKRIKQRIERMTLIGAHLIKECIETLQRSIIVVLISNLEQNARLSSIEVKRRNQAVPDSTCTTNDYENGS